ncbi:MAG: sodium:solute symporter family protein [Proteobacteria bacterium]|nr:sodium:solute symporter family protein [Pseudomonadota bacterium]
MIADGKGLHAAFLLFYLLALIGIGAIKARKIKSQADFSLAGRGLSTFVLVGTLLATWIGTGSIFGNAGETYRNGVDAFLLPLGSAVGIIVLMFLAARIRRFGQFTIQDILEARFGVTARVLGTLTLVLAYVIIVSYQYRAGAAVLAYLLPDLSNLTAILFVAGFVIAYTALAGMFSVAYTDVANGILMTLGIGLAIPILWSQTGGLGEAIASLPAANQSLFGHYGAATLASVLLPAFLLILGDANMVQRFFSARSPDSAQRAAFGMFGGVLVLELAIILTAILAAGLVAQGKIAAPDNDGHVIIHVAFEALPSWLGALLVGTAVAVVVSTADSYLLSPATSIVRDVYQRFLRPDADEQHIVVVGRVVVVIAGLLALGLSMTSDRFFSVALFAYTIYGAGITPVILAAYFWKRATSAGAVSSMIAGVVFSCAWKGMVSQHALLTEAGWTRLGSLGAWADTSGVDAVIPAILLSVGVLVTVSLLTPAPTREQANTI